MHFDNPQQPSSGDIYDWENTWFGSLGADYRLNSMWTLRGGFAVDGSPTSEARRTPRVPDAMRRWVTFGLGYKPSNQFEFNLAYVHLFINDAHVNSVTATSDRLIGVYDASSNLLSASAQYHF